MGQGSPGTRGSVFKRKRQRQLGLITKTGANAFFDATGKLKPLRDVQETLRKSLQGLTKEQKLSKLQTIFGQDAIRAATVLAKDGAGGFDKLAASMGKIKAADVAKTRMDNLKGSLENLKGSAETIGIRIGLKLVPALKRAADETNNFLDEASGLAGTFGPGIAETLAGPFRAARDAAREAAQAVKDFGLSTGILTQKKVQGTRAPDSVVTILGFDPSKITFGNVVGQLVVKFGEALRKIDWFSIGAAAGKNAIPFLIGLASGLLDPGAIGAAFMAHKLAFITGLVTLVSLGMAGVFAKLAGIAARFPLVGKLLEFVFRGLNAVFGRLPRKLLPFGRAFLDGLLSGLGKAFPRLETWIRVHMLAAAQLFAELGSKLPKIGRDAVTRLVRGLGTGIGTVAGVTARIVSAVVRGLGRLAGRAAAAAAKAIGSLVDRLVPGKPVAAAARIVSAVAKELAQGVSGAARAGADFVAGFVRGIVGSIGSAASAAASMAKAAFNAAKSKLDINSPAKVMIPLGAGTVEGYALGIDRAHGLATSSARGMAGATVQAVKDAVSGNNVLPSTFGAAVAGISGAVKSAVTRTFSTELGTVTQTYLFRLVGAVRQAIGASYPSLRTSFNDLATQLESRAGTLRQAAVAKENARFEKQKAATDKAREAALKKAGKREDAAVNARYKALQERQAAAHQKELTGIRLHYDQLEVTYGKYAGNLRAIGVALGDYQTRLDSVTQAITDQQATLDSAQQAYTQFADSISQTFSQFSSITTVPLLDQIIGTDGNGNDITQQVQTAANIVDTLNARLKTAQAFQANILKLQDAGLNGDYVQELAQQGPDAAARAAEALAKATPAQIAAINASQAGIVAAGAQLGVKLADTYFKSGVTQAQSLLDGLLSQQAAIEQAMQKLAEAASKAYARALAGKSFKGVPVPSLADIQNTGAPAPFTAQGAQATTFEFRGQPVTDEGRSIVEALKKHVKLNGPITGLKFA